MSTSGRLLLKKEENILDTVLLLNNSMHIAINATITDPRSSGLGVYTVNVVRELSQLTPSLTVFTSTPELFPESGLSLHQVGIFVRTSIGLRGHVGRILWSHFRLRKYLRRNDIAVLFSPTPLESILGSPVPQVIVVHDLVPLLFPDYHPRQKHFYRSILPKILQSAARIVADSNSTRQDLIESYGLPEEKIDVIYAGYDQQAFSFSEHPSREQHPPSALYVGNLFPHKNLSRLLDAFAVASRQIPHELRIVGYQDPRYYPSLYDKARQLSILDKVKFFGYVSQDQLASLYAAADVFVYPSLYEGFGIPPLEAMACGVPVIASSTKAVREVLGDAAEFVDASDVSAIVHTLITVAESDVKKNRLRAKGFDRVKLFSWRKTALELHRVLVEVAS